MQINQLTQAMIKETPIPLPPLAEQHRIVARIESLFNKLDRAKGLAQAALESFETRKAAILHKAFTGELSAKWRVANGVGLDSWKVKCLAECVLKMQNGISKRHGNDGISTVVLRLANIDGNIIDTSDLREIVLDKCDIKKYALVADDVLIIRVNGSHENVGKLIHIKDNNRWAYCDHLIKCRFDSASVNAPFMIFLSLTNSYREFIENSMVSSAGQNTISQKSLEQSAFLCPTLPEQQEIVRILESLLEKEQQARQHADIIEKIDLMKKAILARAFRRTNA